MPAEAGAVERFAQASSTESSRFESRLSRLLEEPVRSGSQEDALPSILADDVDEDMDVFTNSSDPGTHD